MSKRIPPKKARSLPKKRGPKFKSKKENKIERFISEYLIDQNGTQAAIRAGYSPHTACTAASQLLAKGKVKSRIREGLLELRREAKVDAMDLVQEWKYQSFANQLDYFKPRFDKKTKTLYLKLRNLWKLPDFIQRCVQSIEIEDLDNGGQKVKLRLVDKLKSQEMLAKHLNLFKDGLPTDDEGKIIPIKFIQVPG